MSAPEAIRARGAVRTLLHGAIDYAGLFPPASLDLGAVVANYGAYRRGPDAWALGRLVVPADQLEALGTLARSAASDDTGRDAGGAWPVSALVGAGTAADADRVAAFNRQFGDVAVVDSVESRASTPAQVLGMAGRFDRMAHFVELPLAVDLAPLMAAVRAIGAHAKIRTGGVSADAVPDARDVARFLHACAAAGVAFKATAGLHHPWRGRHRLTYEARAPHGMMFGYLNVFLAAAQARAGAALDDMIRTLEATSTAMLAIEDDEVRWEGGRATTPALAAMRSDFVLGFGSCSFREPIDELDTLYGN